MATKSIKLIITKNFNIFLSLKICLKTNRLINIINLEFSNISSNSKVFCCLNKFHFFNIFNFKLKMAKKCFTLINQHK